MPRVHRSHQRSLTLPRGPGKCICSDFGPGGGPGSAGRPGCTAQAGRGRGGGTGELCFNHSLIHTNLSWNKSLSLTKKKKSTFTTSSAITYEPLQLCHRTKREERPKVIEGHCLSSACDKLWPALKENRTLADQHHLQVEVTLTS